MAAGAFRPGGGRLQHSRRLLFGRPDDADADRGRSPRPSAIRPAATWWRSTLAGREFDGGIVTRITAIPYGLVVDRNAARVDIAGRDAGRTHYARWGPRIADCPGGVAFLILDADGLNRAHPTALPPISADTIGALAAALDLDAAALGRAVEAFNTGRPSRRPVSTPPFSAFPMRPGLTFVHYGLAVDDRMRVSMRDGRTVETLFAAGMIMAANVLRRGYLAGFGLTLSAVSGRRAGEAAARHVLG